MITRHQIQHSIQSLENIVSTLTSSLPRAWLEADANWNLDANNMRTERPYLLLITMSLVKAVHALGSVVLRIHVDPTERRLGS